MKKILGLLTCLLIIAGCGADIDSTIKYNTEDGTVSVVSDIEVSEDELNEVTGGKGAITNSINNNLWDGASLEETNNGYTLTTNFNSVEEYNDFMNEAIGKDGLEIETDNKGFRLRTTYKFEYDVTDYLNDLADKVYTENTFSEYVESGEDLISLHFIDSYIDEEDVFSYKSIEIEPEIIATKFIYNYVTTDEKDLVVENTSFESAQVYIELKNNYTEEQIDSIREEYSDVPLTIEVKDDIVVVSGEITKNDGKIEQVLDAADIDTYISFSCYELEKTFFKTVLECSSYTSDEVGVYGEFVDYELSVTLDGEQLSKEELRGTTIQRYNTSRIIVTCIVLLLVIIVAIVVILILLKKRSKYDSSLETEHLEETPSFEQPTSIIEEDTFDIEETSSDIEETASDIEETASDIEETASDIEETASDIEETASDIEETTEEIK